MDFHGFFQFSFSVFVFALRPDLLLSFAQKIPESVPAVGKPVFLRLGRTEICIRNDSIQRTELSVRIGNREDQK